MKFFRFGEPGLERPGVVDQDGGLRDISALVPDIGGEWLQPGRLQDLLSSVALNELPSSPADARFGPCVANVGNFLAVGLNYADHAAESGMAIPKEPILFNKAPSCIVGPNDNVRLPTGSQKSDWEVELAIVIGAPAFRIPVDRASEVIAGYCVCNDVSEREYQLERGGGQWAKGKGCPTFGPLGPFLVTADEVGDVQALDLWLELNGERVQSGSTATMIFGVDELVAHISEFMMLRPGDVITTGTPPGVGLGMKPPRYLRAGDVMHLGIEMLGAQTQRVVAE